jgi:hypothetical protein
MGGYPTGSRAGVYYWGCYDAASDLVVLPRPEAWPSRREWRRDREHEWAHARGWRHLPNGHGTDWRISLPPPIRLARTELGAASEPVRTGN